LPASVPVDAAKRQELAHGGDPVLDPAPHERASRAHVERAQDLQARLARAVHVREVRGAAGGEESERGDGEGGRAARSRRG
jgi:hypothetical protein